MVVPTQKVPPEVPGAVPVSTRTRSYVFKSTCKSVRHQSWRLRSHPRPSKVSLEREVSSRTTRGVNPRCRGLRPGLRDTKSTFRRCPSPSQSPAGHSHSSLSPRVTPSVTPIRPSGSDHVPRGSLWRGKGLRGPRKGRNPNLGDRGRDLRT